MKAAAIITGITLFSFWAVGRATDHELATASTTTQGGDAYAIDPTANHRSEPGGNVSRPGLLYQGKTARWWANRAVQARKDANARGRTIRRLQRAQARESAHFFDWMAAADCVHQHEGSWTSATGNGYYGGFQADRGFQRTYAPDHYARWGTANNWPWVAQLEMAYRGWLFRGWTPWPATSRMCGLR